MLLLSTSRPYGLLTDWSLYAGTNMANPAAYACSKELLFSSPAGYLLLCLPDSINAISPGGIARSQPSVFVERYCARTPLRRMASEEDFKGVVALMLLTPLPILPVKILL